MIGRTCTGVPGGHALWGAVHTTGYEMMPRPAGDNSFRNSTAKQELLLLRQDLQQFLIGFLFVTDLDQISRRPYIIDLVKLPRAELSL